MKETELWELLVSLSANEISLEEAHDRIWRLGNDVERNEQGQLRIGAVMCWVDSSERIPENRQEVLCFNGHRMIENSWCLHTDQDAEWFKRTFTHWTEDVLPPCR